LCIRLGVTYYPPLGDLHHHGSYAQREILCMQSQQSSVNYRDGYNKLTCINHTVTRITPVPFALMREDQIKYK